MSAVSYGPVDRLVSHYVTLYGPVSDSGSPPHPYPPPPRVGPARRKPPSYRRLLGVTRPRRPTRIATLWPTVARGVGVGERGVGAGERQLRLCGSVRATSPYNSPQSDRPAVKRARMRSGAARFLEDVFKAARHMAFGYMS